MVYTTHKTATGAMKRSASALEGPPGWDVAPVSMSQEIYLVQSLTLLQPMMTPTRSTFRLPYAHYAMIYLDNEGKLRVDESPSIQEQSSTIFTPQVRQNFLDILGEKIGFHQPSSHRKPYLLYYYAQLPSDSCNRYYGHLASPRPPPPGARPVYCR